MDRADGRAASDGLTTLAAMSARRALIALPAALAFAAPAHAATTCDEPGAQWHRAKPADVDMDAAKLQSAIDYGTQNAGFAVRVYRHGCLVGEDRAAAANSRQQFESWSMAKSVVSLLFGRAMTMGLISPDDPVGSLLPEADQGHGAITMRDLLTQSSGLHWNGFRDYNIFSTPDRVHDALTLPIDHPPGTYFEYAQSPVALLAEAVGRSAGEDVQAFGQRELFDPLGIPKDAWKWTRDSAGHIQGFYGVNMTPDDYARLGDVLRRGGVWNGKRLLSHRYVREAVAPSATNGCYAWLIWTNGGTPCIGPTIGSRPVSEEREFPGLPHDLWNFSGLFGQLVTVFPTQDVEVVRTGQDTGLAFSAANSSGGDWEQGLYERVLAALTDTKPVAGDSPRVPAAAATDHDYGFQTAFLHPDDYGKGTSQDPLPPAGSARARALRPRLAHQRASRTGGVSLRVTCPARWPGWNVNAGCVGQAEMGGARAAVPYALAPGGTQVLRFRLTAKALRALRAAGRVTMAVMTTNVDTAGGTTGRITVSVLRPRGPRPRS